METEKRKNIALGPTYMYMYVLIYESSFDSGDMCSSDGTRNGLCTALLNM